MAESGQGGAGAWEARRRRARPPRPAAAATPQPPRREWLYGRQAVREALRGPRTPHRLWLAEGGRRSGIVGEVLQLAGRRGVRAEDRPADELTKLVGPVNHQGVVLLCEPYAYADFEDVLANERATAPLFLVLDALQDPQNFGALLRTAEATGVTVVLIPEHRQVGVTPAVVNASAGAVEHLAVARVGNLTRAVERLKEVGVWVAGLEQDVAATAPWAVDLTGPLALVVGSEGEGLSRLVREHCDFLLTLPMAGRIDALNAAVAGSVALYEIVRQRAMQARPDADAAPA